MLVRDAEDSKKADLAAEVRNTIRQDLTLEIWNESDLLRRIEHCFGVALDTIVTKDLHSVRRAINAKKWITAFGESNCGRLSDMLLWHFGAWNLRRLNREQGLQPEGVLTPRL